ncbi:MAG: response regulator transcription factor [Pseudonocardia sp.]|nr:response regulator transcription factor [Pseudonocardia sp.]MBO0878297.1 response regulator transcription factor [Pseudonocardia sp.]
MTDARTGPQPRVLLVDDHELVRAGLRTFLALQPDIEVVGEASSGERALALVSTTAPNIVLLDLVLPGMSGLETVRALRAAHPDIKIVVLTSFAGQDQVLPVVRAGVAGYLLKDVGPRELADALRSVHAGGAPLHPTVAATVMRSVTADDPLTPREREVLRLIARGLSNRQIARELVLAEKTVKTHVSAVLAKLGVADRTQAALLAIRDGIAG